MSQRFVMGFGVVLPFVLLTVSGCVATRGWVDERVGVVEQQRRQDVARLDGVEVSVREAGETAKGARTRADEVDARLTRLWEKRNSRNLSDSVTVQFRFNKWDLDDAAETALVGLVRD